MKRSLFTLFLATLAARDALVTELLADPAKAHAMGDAGHKRVEDIFSWTAIAAQTIQLYDSLIAARNS